MSFCYDIQTSITSILEILAVKMGAWKAYTLWHHIEGGIIRKRLEFLLKMNNLEVC